MTSQTIAYSTIYKNLQLLFKTETGFEDGNLTLDFQYFNPWDKSFVEILNLTGSPKGLRKLTKSLSEGTTAIQFFWRPL